MLLASFQIETIKNQRDSWGTETLQTVTSVNQTSSLTDTHTMISAIANGKGIVEPLEPVKATPVVQPQSQPMPRAGSKVPGIKTNIKAGSKQNF